MVFSVAAGCSTDEPSIQPNQLSGPNKGDPVGDHALAFATGGYADTSFDLDRNVKEKSHSITFRVMFQYPNSFLNDVIGSTGAVYAISKPEAPSGSPVLGHELVFRINDSLNDQFYVFNTIDVPRARWINVALTVEKPVPTGALYLIKIYVDGVLEANGALEASRWGKLGNLRFGQQAVPSGQPPGQFYGLLDNVAVWNKVLSPTDVAALSHDENLVTGREAGLLAAWTFDPMATTSRPDRSLTLVGSTFGGVRYVTVTGDDSTDSHVLPQPNEQTVLSDPLSGPWRVTQGVDGAAPQSHRGYASFSIDFRNHDTEAGSYGQPIHAAADGRVVFFRDTSPDHPQGVVPGCVPCPISIDASNQGQCKFESNEVILAHGTAFNQPGEYSFYQHLRTGSIPSTIKEKWATGELVRRGEILGQTGQSGNASGAQLHFSYYWYVTIPAAFDRSTRVRSFDPLLPPPDTPNPTCGYTPAVPPEARVLTRPFALANYHDYLGGVGPMVFFPRGTPARSDVVSATSFSP